MINEDGLRKILKERCDKVGQAGTGRELGFSTSYIHDVLFGQSISGALALAMGYRMEKTVVRKFYLVEGDVAEAHQEAQ